VLNLLLLSAVLDTLKGNADQLFQLKQEVVAENKVSQYFDPWGDAVEAAHFPSAMAAPMSLFRHCIATMCFQLWPLLGC
jgi:hypothetical protein